MSSTYVITFQSTHAAMASSKALDKRGLTHYTIPTPREIRTGCGIALKLSATEQEIREAWGLLLAKGLSEADMALNLRIAEDDYLEIAL